MLLVPYRFSLELLHAPVLTVLVAIACLATYASQYSSEQRFERAAESFCTDRLNGFERMMMSNIAREAPENACLEIMVGATVSEQREQLFNEMAQGSRKLSGYTADESTAFTLSFLKDTYSRFSAAAPAFKSRDLWYHPRSWNPTKMLTAAFAHGSWSHVIGNLFFYFAFAAGVEAILGPLLYSVAFLALAFGTHIAYSLAMASVVSAPPTLGLSGVVMGMMALLTYFVPQGRVKCFYWIFIRFGVVAIPAWMLFVWFAGWDTYTLATNEEMGEINLVAHVSGAFIGYGMGLLFFRHHKQELAAID